MNKPLGVRCRAQQIVLKQNLSDCHSWRDVDARIKQVAKELKNEGKK